MGLRHYKIQLASLADGTNITDASGTGGTVYVAQPGIQKKQSLFNKDGSVLANPIVMTNGTIEFYTQDTVFSVDLYGQSGAGRGFVKKNVVPSGPNEIYIDTLTRETTLVIPFDATDSAATVEQDTGFNLPTNSLTELWGSYIEVVTLQAGKTINVGTLSTEATGVAAGFMNAVSMAAVGTFPPAAVVTAGVLASNTVGTQLADYTVGTNTDDRGIFSPKQYRCDGVTISISYTTSAGTTTATGLICLKMTLPPV